MLKIGILSDTHGYSHPKLFEFFKDCDEIWHAGDMMTSDILIELEAITKVRAVYGNCDGYDIRIRYPEILRFKCEDVDVMMKHIGGYPSKYDSSIRNMIFSSPPDLFISGHSHILKVMPDKSLHLLHINPGAAGLMGWQKERTLIRLTIEGNKFTDCEVITLGTNKSQL